MIPHRTFQAERWKPDESAAGAYLRGEKIILHGSCITTIGGLDCGPYRIFDASISNSDLGTAILAVLAAAKIATPPSDLKLEQQKLFTCAGVPSWNQFKRALIYCHIGFKPERITILPTRNEGRTFFHLSDQAIKLPTNIAPEELGTALRNAFSKST